MARNKKFGPPPESDGDVEAADAATELPVADPEAADAATELPAVDPGYDVKKWLGHPSYHCRTCALGTLSKDEIERHVCRAARTT